MVISRVSGQNAQVKVQESLIYKIVKNIFMVIGLPFALIRLAFSKLLESKKSAKTVVSQNFDRRLFQVKPKGST